MKKILFYIRVIGIIILIYILSKLQYGKLFEVLKSINLLYLFIYMVFYVAFVCLRTARFRSILIHYGEKPTFLDVFGAMIESQYLGFVTPSRIGDSVKILFLYEKSNISKKIGTITYIYDRFQDLYMLALLGAISFIFILNLPLNIYLGIFIIFIIVMFLFRNKILVKISGKIKMDDIKKLNFQTDFMLFLLNIFIYLFYFMQYYFLALSLKIHIDFFYLSAVSIIGALAAVLPISLSGIGVREGVFIYYLTKAGVSKESAFLLSFLDNAGFTILFVVILHIAYKILDSKMKNR